VRLCHGKGCLCFLAEAASGLGLNFGTDSWNFGSLQLNPEQQSTSDCSLDALAKLHLEQSSQVQITGRSFSILGEPLWLSGKVVE
jgi:hypothetical protein